MAAVVIDASALIRLLTGVSTAWEPSASDDLHAPSVVDTEVVATLRGASLRGVIPVRRAEEMLLDFVALPITRHHQMRLIARVWQMRNNFAVADAMYVALAEELGADLVTHDRYLARAIRRHTSVPVLP